MTVDFACTWDVDGDVRTFGIPGCAGRTLTPVDLQGGYTGLPVGADCALTVRGELVCTWRIGEVPIEIDGGAGRGLSLGGAAVVYTGVSVGADGVVTETDTAGASSSYVMFEGATVEDVSVEAPATGETAEVDFVNVYDATALEVTKEFTGAGADLAGPVTVELACTWEVAGEQLDVDTPGGPERELSAPDELTTTYENLPVGAACEIRETDTAGAASTTISVADETTDAPRPRS